MARVTELRRLPLADMAVLLLVTGLLWAVPLLLGGSAGRSGPMLPRAAAPLSDEQAALEARAEVLALALAAPVGTASEAGTRTAR